MPGERGLIQITHGFTTFAQIPFDVNPLFLKPIELWQNLACRLGMADSDTAISI